MFTDGWTLCELVGFGFCSQFFDLLRYLLNFVLLLDYFLYNLRISCRHLGIDGSLFDGFPILLTLVDHLLQIGLELHFVLSFYSCFLNWLFILDLIYVICFCSLLNGNGHGWLW